MKEIVSAWSSFIHDGKPVIPVPNISWPLYTVQGRQILYMQPNNYTAARDSDQDHCDIWRPFLLKNAVTPTPEPKQPPVSKGPEYHKPQTKTRLRPEDNLVSSGREECYVVPLFILALLLPMWAL
ncbi:acetylcholinesterase [Ixodes scapularis]